MNLIIKCSKFNRKGKLKIEWNWGVSYLVGTWHGYTRKKWRSMAIFMKKEKKKKKEGTFAPYFFYNKIEKIIELLNTPQPCNLEIIYPPLCGSYKPLLLHK